MRRPDRAVIVVCALAWVWMLAHVAASPRLTCCHPHPPLSEDAAGWVGMVLAMMLPVTLASVRDVADRSYRARRSRAVVAYLAGYLACWLALGVAVVAAHQAFARTPHVATALCVVGAAWCFLPARERWRRRAHRRIAMCPVGPRADLDAWLQGAMQGAPCVAACWPVLAACAFAGHPLLLMLGGGALVLAEARMFRLERLPLALGALALAGVTLLQ
jgi:predicted metal-binding membrane protein